MKTAGTVKCSACFTFSRGKDQSVSSSIFHHSVWGNYLHWVIGPWAHQKKTAQRQRLFSEERLSPFTGQWLKTLTTKLIISHQIMTQKKIETKSLCRCSYWTENRSTKSFHRRVYIRWKTWEKASSEKFIYRRTVQQKTQKLESFLSL